VWMTGYSGSLYVQYANTTLQHQIVKHSHDIN
jgi:hypothetical protein